MKGFEIRDYRHRVRPKGLVPFGVVYRESDLQVMAERDLSRQALAFLKEERSPLEAYIMAHPEFLKALKPVKVEPAAPDLVKEMAQAARAAGTGPMAAVAGAIAERVGRRLMEEGLTKEVVVENGGDIFLALKREATVALWAGSSPLSGRVGLKIRASMMPLGVCTSSATVGHSLSLGCADAVCVLAPSTALADACATALGNLVKGKRSWDKVLSQARRIPSLKGLVCILGEKLWAWGEWVELVPIAG